MFKNMCTMFTIPLALAIAAMAQADQTDVRQILTTRFAKLQNLIAEYKVTTEWLSPVSAEHVVTRTGPKGFTVARTGIRVTAREFSVLGNRCLYDERLESWDRKIKIEDRHSHVISTAQRQFDVYGPDRTEHLLVTKGASDTQRPPRHRGEIRNQKNLPAGNLDIALGLRQRGQPALLTDELIKEMTISRSNNGQVVLSNVDAKGRTHEWIFDPKLGYGLTFYRMRVPPDNHVNIEFAMEDFKNVNGILLPFRVNAKWMVPQKGTTRTETIEVSEYRLGDPANTVERYSIKWPEGTTVFDTRSRMPFHIRGGKMVYVGADRIDKMILDEVANIPPVITNTSAPSSDANEPNEIVAAIEKKPANLPVGDVVPPLESVKSFSAFWKLAGVLILAAVVVGFFAYRRSQVHPKG